MSTVHVAIARNELADLCRRHGVGRLALFGSVLRDDFRADSDVDVLVEFLPGRTPGLAFFALQNELSKLLGRTVDLNTPDCLGREIRRQVLAACEELYVAP
jgi:predicted nucleotidyltransferase